MTSWGRERHFKHFLPRILELCIEHEDNFFDLPVVFGKLERAHWQQWSTTEQDAVKSFFSAYWVWQLQQPIYGTFEDSAETALVSIAIVSPSVTQFLDAWLTFDTASAKRHLGAFILNNASTLMGNGQLATCYLDGAGKQHREIVDWLTSDATMTYVLSADASCFSDDFQYTIPQLNGIRAAICPDV
jgi:hypothetical protein